MIELLLDCGEMREKISHRLGQPLAQCFQASEKFSFLLRLQQQLVLKHFPESFKTIDLVAFLGGLVHSHPVVSWGFAQILAGVYAFVLFGRVYCWF